MNAQAVLNAELCVRLLTTLGHFVWQGALLGIVAVLISVILKRRSAALRHNLYLVILCAMALCPVLTILAMGTGASPRQFDASTMPAPNALDETTPIAALPAQIPENSASLEIAANPIHAGLDAAPVLPVNHSSDGSSAVPWRLDWRAHAPVVTAAYFAGVALLLIRLTVGLIGGGRLRRRSRPVTEGELLASLARGAESLGMRFAPALAFCEDVAVPTVVGVIRPIVLLPVAIASGFTPQQVEWLLLHELAHVRRWDHIINLFQRVVEAALFYHPAVWFVSNRIRVEREHCCDDVVVTLGGAAHEYAGALVTAAALCTGHGALATKTALAAVNKPGHLRVRIERLLGGPGPSLRLGRGSWLAVAVVGVTAVLTFNVMASGTKVGEPASSGDESAVAASGAPVDEPAASLASLAEETRELLKLAQGESVAPTPDAPPDAARPASAPAKPAVSKPDAEPAKDAKEASAEREAPAVPSKSLVSDFDKLTPEVQELITQLDDPDWWLRKLAVQQLSEKNDPHAVTLLIPKLTDTDKRVQAAAAEALGRTADPRAIKHLVAVLEEKGDVANAAADALTHFPAEKVIPILRLAAADPDMRLGALNALARWDRPEVLEVLVSMLPSIVSAHQDNKVSTLRYELARDFGKQLPDRVAEKLSEASKSSDAKIRIGVAELFAPAWQVRSQPETRSLDPASVVASLYQNPRAMDILTTLSNDAERNARAAAVDALGGVAVWDRNARRPPNAPALEALTKRLRDEDWSICAHAAKMLEAAGWQPSGPEDRAWSLVGLERPKDAALLGEAALEPLLHLLGSSRTNPYSFGGVSSRVMRPARRGDSLSDDAIAALGEIKSQRAVPVLVELLKSESESSAQWAARALGQIGGAAAADGLASALAASSADVRWACLDALASLKDSRGVAPLIELLTGENERMHDFAGERLRLYEGSKTLTDAVPVQDLMKMLSNKDGKVRAFALDTLKTLDDPQVAPAVISILESEKSSELRKRAADYLGDKKTAGAVDLLTKVLFNEKHDDKSPLPQSIVRALGQIGGAQAFQALIRVTTMPEFSVLTVSEAINSLAATKDMNAVAPLAQYLVSHASDPSPIPTSMQSTTAKALGDLGGPDAAKALADGALVRIAKLGSQDGRVDPYVSALARIAPPHSTDALYGLLKERSCLIPKDKADGQAMTSRDTLTVAVTLASLGDPRSEEFLRGLMTLPETRVPAEQALKALQEKTGKAPDASSAPPAPAPGAAAAAGSKEWMVKLVEDFFQHNYRDITSRETVEWGEVTKTPEGNFAIRYKCTAKIGDKATKTLNQLFTFASDGKFVSAKDVAETASGKQASAKPALVSTGNPFEWAIDGDGYFQISLPDGRTVYTRDGKFHLDAGGQLVTADGLPVVPAMHVPQGSVSLIVAFDGRVSAIDPNGQQVELGQVTLAGFKNPDGLRDWRGRSLFLSTDDSGAPVVTTPGENDMGTIQQGFMEQARGTASPALAPAAAGRS